MQLSLIFTVLSFVLLTAPISSVHSAATSDNLTPHDALDFPGADNLYEAPTEESVRGPCPFINTIANHGFINRSGKNIDVFEMVDIMAQLFGVSADFLLNGPTNAAIQLGVTYTDEDGVVRLDLDRLHEHNALEHDASMFRVDSFYGEDRSFRVEDSLFNSFLRFNPNSNVVTKEDLIKLHFDRIIDSRTSNPEFTLPNGVSGLSVQAVLVLSVGQDPELGFVDKKILIQFFLLERFPDDYVVPQLDTITFFNDVSAMVAAEFIESDQIALAADLPSS